MLSQINLLPSNNQSLIKTLLLSCYLYHVFKVGGNYGRKMMTGCFRSIGVSMSERKVGNALKKTCPSTQAERCMQAGK